MGAGHGDRPLLAGGAPLADEDWSYDAETGVLTATYTTASAPLEVSGC